MARVLFHIDLNAFFASAEELRHPEYKGKPMAVGSDSARGVLATANYEARKLGLHSAMPVMQAKAMVPDLILVPGDHAYYRQLSSQFFDYLRQYSPMLEPLSIDECFLDVTDIIQRYKRPLDLAVQIQQGVYEQFGLPCSIGVAPNRFLAKMASDMRKPMGISVLRKSEVSTKLWPLPVEDMVGIGKKTVPKLQEQGIKTIGDLADPANESKVLTLLKSHGMQAIQRARGNDRDQLNYSRSRKSISISRTYDSDIYTLEEVLHHLEGMARHLSQQLRQQHQKGMLISVILRDTAFHNKMHSQSLKDYTDAFETIYQHAGSLAQENFEPIGYRHIGLAVGSLKNADQILMQPSLFDVPIQTTSDIITRLNAKEEGKVFMKASDLLKEKKHEK